MWPDLETAPGGKYARLREARIVDEDGALTSAADVRRPVGVELTWTVLRDDVPLFPKIKLIDSEGDVAFNALDTDPKWSEPPELGDYVATAWIPGNLLNEGLYTVDVEVCALGPLGMPKLVLMAGAREALSFHVHDPGEGDSSKGRLPRPHARRGQAAARVDERAALGAPMQVAAVVLLHNEDVFAERVIRNVAGVL